MATETTRARMDETARALKDNLRELRHVTGEAARETAQELKEKVSHSVAAGRETAVQAAEDVRGRVRSKPLRWVAVSAGVGVLVGYMLHRRRSARHAGNGD